MAVGVLRIAKGFDFSEHFKCLDDQTGRTETTEKCIHSCLPNGNKIIFIYHSC